MKPPVTLIVVVLSILSAVLLTALITSRGDAKTRSTAALPAEVTEAANAVTQRAQAPVPAQPAQPKGPRVVAPLPKEEQAKLEADMKELAELRTIVQGETVAWARTNANSQRLEKQFKAVRSWIEDKAKTLKLKAPCFAGLLDERGQQACGGDVWGVVDGQIVVAK